MGALRLGKLARYLCDKGHDVRVLASTSAALEVSVLSLSPGIEASRIVRARTRDVNAPIAALSDLVKALRNVLGSTRGADSDASAECGAASKAMASKSMSRAMKDFLQNATNFPDPMIGWLPGAVLAGRKLLGNWHPDLIYASGPPFTGLMVGHLLKRMCGARLVVEYRDRWFDDPYYPPPPWRQNLDLRAEAGTMRNADAVVTVSEPWAETYRERYGKPTVVVYNGYDPDDIGHGPFCGSPDKEYLRIVYTGLIYPGRRDPTALFEALARRRYSKNDVRVEFYEADPSVILPLAEQTAVGGLIDVKPFVPYSEALELQRRGDILLLMQWNNPKEQGNVPGKLFEYLGARRPILGLGLDNGVPASIIRSRRAGFFGNDPEEIGRKIEEWILLKRQRGCVPQLPEQAIVGFSRAEQFARLEAFLDRIV